MACAICSWVCAWAAAATGPAAPGPAGVRFERDIQPLLAEHCHACHGEDVREGRLDLRTLAAILRGGEHGPAVVPGHPQRSEMLDMILSGKMPPEGQERLSSAEAAAIRRWIEAGCPADQPPERPQVERPSHWAYQKLRQHPTPVGPNDDSTDTPIDAFLWVQLAAKGLRWSPPADRATLIRRLSFDLLGLPPQPDEVRQFARDARPDAYQRLVDRLLASPHFGERWGRHWLDSAGYVEVVGSDNDAAIIKPLTGRWRYRDYVVQAFNHEKPFSEFVLEQLAGDELVDWQNAAYFTQEMRDKLIATGFLLSAPDDTDQPELNTLDIRHRVLQKTGEIVASNLLACTVQCARCHDHKYEAIPQREYYQWLAIFAAAFNPQRWIVSNARGLPDVSPATKQRIDAENAVLDDRVQQLRQQQEAVRASYRQRLFEARLAKLSGELQPLVRQAFETPAERRDVGQQQLAETYRATLHIDAKAITAALSSVDRLRLAELEHQITATNRHRRQYGTIQAVFESAAPPPVYLLRRGQFDRPGSEVRAALFSVLDPGAQTKNATPANGSSGERLRLARQLTAPDSVAAALLARVAVNRVWQHLFGTGIVATSDNFGVSGARPTHEALLDWLAIEFIRGDWQLKPLLRAIVVSRAYRQSSGTIQANPRPLRLDPDNRLLWRMPLRRLESEAIRDALLSVSGNLSRVLGGPSLPLQNLVGGQVVVASEELSATDWGRRSLYILPRRNYHHSLLAVFDQPVLATNCTQREQSAVVTQSLTMMNDSFVWEQARSLAARVLESRERSAPHAYAHEYVHEAFELCLSRRASAAEARWCLQAIERNRQRFLTAGSSDLEALQESLEHFCHTLLNTSEFLYLR